MILSGNDPLRMAKAYREWFVEHFLQQCIPPIQRPNYAAFVKNLDMMIIEETANTTLANELAERIVNDAYVAQADERLAARILIKWTLRSFADDDSLDFGDERFDAAYAAAIVHDIRDRTRHPIGT